jgi:hypothetical protein
MIVSELYVYPIKSCQGIKLKQAEVLPKGFLWDREMMLVTKKGKFLTQRQFPRLAQVKVQIVNEAITVSTEDNSIAPLTFTPTLRGTTIEVSIWQDTAVAVDQGNTVAQWFHRVLELDENKECRLVRQSPQYIRSVKTSEPVSFADNFPFMMTATASLEELNQRIVEIRQQSAEAIPMNRFRPNIVIRTNIPFVEDNWRMIQIGKVRFFVVKPSSRCIITTIDQQRGEKNQYKEPLSTLGTFRQFSEQGVMFGENMIPRNTGIIKVGDRLQVLQLREPK